MVASPATVLMLAGFLAPHSFAVGLKLAVDDEQMHGRGRTEPKKSATPLLHYDASVTSSIATTVGDKVYEWRDLGTEGSDLSPIGQAPTYFSSGGYVEFTGSLDQGLRSTRLAAGVMANPLHYVFDADLASTSGSQSASFGYVMDGYDFDTCSLGINGDDVMPYQGRRFHNSGENLATRQIFEIVFNGANSKFAVNGGAWTTGSAGSTKDCRGVTLGVDASPRWAYNYDKTWKLYEVAVFTGDPSDEERLQRFSAMSQTTVQGAAEATGDPHLQNMYGQRFDLMQPGIHALLHVPRGAVRESTLLHVSADAKRLGKQCADMYFQKLNVTGAWAEVHWAGGLSFRAHGDEPETTHAGLLDKWMTFGMVELKVVRGQTAGGDRYLNLFVKKLGRVSAMGVGGLLGEDDHTAAATADGDCGRVLNLGLARGNVTGPSASLAHASL